MTDIREGREPLYAVLAVLILGTAIAYLGVFHSGFVFDDGLYLVDNPNVQAGLTFAGMKWAFTSFFGANWHPVTWLSMLLDIRLFGMKPLGLHATSLLFHIVNTVLLLLVLRRFTGSFWRSAFVAALFALHPLHVESVAWITERKDVLSTSFMLISIWAYAGYAERPDPARYLLVACAFALGLMAKPMLVSLPILLLLLDYWPLRRTSGLGRLAVEKMPLFALSAASCVITYMAQRSGEAVMQLERFPIGLRVANSVVSYATYLGKAVCPTGLAAYYPYPSEGVAPYLVAVSLIVMAGVSALVALQVKRRPYLVVGWLWYVITLIPVIGLVQVGEQSMADRYTYVPLIGVFVMVAWGVPDSLRSIRTRGSGEKPGGRSTETPLVVVACVIVMALAVCTFRQVGYWQSNYTLFKRVVSVTKGNALALSNYGLALAEKGDYDEAIVQYNAAIKANPLYVQSYMNLGNALKDTGKTEAALTQYQEALRIKPEYTAASVAVANIMAEQGQSDAAADEYTRALETNPNDAFAHYNLGRVLADKGSPDDAAVHFERAIELKPNFDKAHYGLAVIASRRGEADKAIEHYQEALRINSNNALAHHGLAMMLGAQGRTDDAADHFQQALSINPRLVEAHNDYGILLARQGRTDEAIAQFTDAIKLRPSFADAHCNLALGLASQGKLDAAIAQYRRAIKANPSHALSHGNLAIALYQSGRFAESWQEVRNAESYGMKLPPDFLKALSSKMTPR